MSTKCPLDILSGRTGEKVWETFARPGTHFSSKTATISQIVGSLGCLRPDLGGAKIIRGIILGNRRPLVIRLRL